MRQERRGSWYILTGVILGLAFGLGYSWMVSPVKYIDAPPYSLREDYKEQYRVLVAVAYLYSGDLLRAQDRLVQLKDADISTTLAMQAQRALAEGHPEEEVRALSLLASALNKAIPPTSVEPTSTPNILQSTPPLAASPTIELPAPSATITSTIGLSETQTAPQLTPIP